jgi:hypothetical protein
MRRLSRGPLGQGPGPGRRGHPTHYPGVSQTEGDMRRCAGPECGRPAWAKGLCHAHYLQRRRHPETPLRPLFSGQCIECGRRTTLRAGGQTPLCGFVCRQNNQRSSKRRWNASPSGQAYARGWRELHATRRVQQRRQWRAENRDYENAVTRARTARMRARLHTTYVKRLLMRDQSWISLPPILIGVKRAQLKLHRDTTTKGRNSK